MWIVPCDSFLMKKLLKSDIYGSMNSASMHCSRLKSQHLPLKAIKKKYGVETRCKRSKRPNCTLTVALWTQNLEIFLGLHSMTPLVGFRLYFSVTINIGERLVTTLFSIFFIRCEFWQIHNLNYIFFLYILYLQNFHKTKNQ